MTFERAIVGGRIVTGGEVRTADVLVNGGRIAGVVEPGTSFDAAETVDASGKLVFPGMIDVHVHAREPGYTHKEDITTCSAAAAAGGVTTFFGMPNVDPPTVSREYLDQVFDLYNAKSIVDYNHNPVPSQPDQVALMAEAGIAAYKVYMVVDTGRNYPHPSGTGIHDHGHLLQMMESVAETGLPFMIHPHDQAIMDVVEQGFWKVDDRSPEAYAKTLAAYDGLIWDSAVGTILRMAEATDCRLHIVHTQTTRSIEMIRRAREAGVDVSAEVNHWALFLSRWSDIQEQGAYALSYWVPDHHREAVWEALNDGTIEMLSSDHAPHTREEKDVGWDDTWAAHTGTPGIQYQLELMINAWHEGRVGLETIAAATAENPAATFGLTNKGSIVAGKDADLAVIDPDAEWTISNDGVLSRCGWTPYDGRTVKGKVVRTIVRGADVYRDGEVVGQPGWGELARPTL